MRDYVDIVTEEIEKMNYRDEYLTETDSIHRSEIDKIMNSDNNDNSDHQDRDEVSQYGLEKTDDDNKTDSVKTGENQSHKFVFELPEIYGELHSGSFSHTFLYSTASHF
jgi:hypothetical protein